MTAFEPGGTERQMSELVRRLDPARFKVHVACLHKRGAWLPRVAERAASVVEFPIQGFARAATVAQMLAFARWCRRERIAVVQTCDLYANIFGLPGAALARVPVRIGSRRELNPDKSPGQIRLQRLAYRSATKVVANSQAARQILEAEGLEPRSIAVIPNGVDPRPSSGVNSAAPVRTIITVANLRPEKSHETLLAAAAHARRRASRAALPNRRRRASPRGARTAGGDARREPSRRVPGPQRRRPRAARGRRRVRAAVALRGVSQWRDRSDGGGAAGGRLRGRRAPRSDRGRQHRPPGAARATCDALSRALRSLIDAPARADAIGAAARECVQQRYSFERMVASFEDLYSQSFAAACRPGRTKRRRRESDMCGIAGRFNFDSAAARRSRRARRDDRRRRAPRA